MTLLTSDPVTPGSHPEVINAFVRSEVHLILDALINELDPDRHSYLAGVYLGYSVALGWLDRTIVEEARRAPFASTIPLDVALRPIRSAHVESERLRACGTLWGYSQATRFQPDADECGSCGARLLTETDDVDYCMRDMLRFCGDGACIESWHVGRCSQCDAE